MVVLLFLSVLLVAYSFINYKCAVYITSVILVLQTHLLSGIPGVRLFYLVALVQMVLFFVNNERFKSMQFVYPWLLILPCTLAILGYLYSSYNGVSKHYGEIIVSSICTFIYPFVLYKEIRNKNDLVFFFKVFLTFWLIVGIYTIIEVLTDTNIYSKLIDEADAAKGFYGGVEEKERYGIRRCNSLFVFCSTLGMTSAFTFFIMFYLRINNLSFHNKRIENIILVLMPICVFLSGSRSIFLVFIICIIPFIFTKKTYKTMIFKVFVVIGVLTIPFLLDYFETIINSMVYTNNTSGSSTEMRRGQLEVCLHYIRNTPIWGSGKGFIVDYVMPRHPELYGAESIWFRQMVDYGFVGCFTYFFMVLGAAVWVWKFNKKFVFIPIAFIIGKTVSIVLGVEISFLYITCIVLQKINSFCIANKHTI